MSVTNEEKIYSEIKCPKCKCKEGYRVLYNGHKIDDYNTDIYRIICKKCGNRFLTKAED